MVQSNKWANGERDGAASSAMALFSNDGDDRRTGGGHPVNEAQPLLLSVEPQSQPQPVVWTSDNLPANESSLEREQQLEEQHKARTLGAGIATGIVGSLLLGPVVGLLLGFGAAFASSKEGALGDSARAVGDVALVVQAKAQEIDDKHAVVQKSQQLARQTWDKARELDQRHHILPKVREFCVYCATSVQEFCQHHHVVERSGQAAGRAASWVGEQIGQAVGAAVAREEEEEAQNQTQAQVPPQPH